MSRKMARATFADAQIVRQARAERRRRQATYRDDAEARQARQEAVQAALRRELVLGGQHALLANVGPEGPYRIVAARGNHEQAAGFGQDIWFEVQDGRCPTLRDAAAIAVMYRQYESLAEWRIEVYPAEGPAILTLGEVR